MWRQIGLGLLLSCTSPVASRDCDTAACNMMQRMTSNATREQLLRDVLAIIAGMEHARTHPIQRVAKGAKP